MSHWDERFIALCHEIASWSKDSTKVGCVIVGPGRDIRATGFNGIPRGVRDDIGSRSERPDKYLWTEHAERNAIYHAARSGVSVEGCTLYMPWYPCSDCARAIIQSGISTIVCSELPSEGHWLESWRVADQMMREAGVAHRIAGAA